jgi:TolA-binding protein
MKNLIVPLFLVVMTLVSQTIQAEEKAEVTLSFWDKLRSKIEQIVPQKKVSATTAVGGVRGAKMAADDVYWKGEKVAESLDTEELDAFKSAMALAAAGDLAKAQIAFSEFVTKNPESPLRKDAEQALAQLQPAK